MNTERLAIQITRAIDEAAGGPETAEMDRSASSESCYVSAILDDDQDGIREIRIRVARHEPRPTYEAQRPSGFHVGTVVRRDGRVSFLHQDTDGDWLDAVAWACSRLGLKLPARLARLTARRDAAVSARKDRVQREAERVKAEREGAAKRYAVALANLAPEHQTSLDEYDSLTGKRRKRFRGKPRFRKAKTALAELMTL